MNNQSQDLPTYAEVVEVFQQRFPREYEIAILTVQNRRLADAVQKQDIIENVSDSPDE